MVEVGGISGGSLEEMCFFLVALQGKVLPAPRSQSFDFKKWSSCTQFPKAVIVFLLTKMNHEDKAEWYLLVAVVHGTNACFFVDDDDDDDDDDGDDSD